MSYQFPPEVSQLVQQQMSTGGYESEDQLLLDALVALEDVQAREVALRDEIKRRMTKVGRGLSQPLDFEAFKLEARRRLTLRDQGRSE